MTIGDRRLFVCDCEGSMRIDGGRLAAALGTEAVPVLTQLCRSQIDAVRGATTAARPAIVCCTQEAPLFAEIAGEAGGTAPLTFVNIRERAGWSVEGGGAVAKMAALIAEAAVDVPPATTVAMTSDGVVLVLGRGETALEAARQLARRAKVTLVVTGDDELMPPPVTALPVFRGTVRRADGHLGAFTCIVDGFAATRPSSRRVLAFGAATDGQVLSADVIVDLTGAPPLFAAADRRDGYLRAEPSDPVRVQRVLFDAADLIGTFEKPRYLRVDPALCAHSRNGRVGCDLCLDVCPTGAVTPAGDHTRVDAYVCSGHGACASVCPTGAIVFDVPRAEGLLERLRVLIRTYRTAGGRHPVLLIHAAEAGGAVIDAIARHGRGLPAHVVPFAVNAVTMVGLDLLLAALAWGAAQVRLLAGAEADDDLAALETHARLIDAVMAGLGYPGGRVVIDRVADPADLEAALYAPPPPAPAEAARFAGSADKRTTQRLALDHLHAHAPAPVDLVALAPGAPFGSIVLDLGRCTLCLSCVGVCPTAALGDNPDRPQLTFVESACVQCGLCRVTCPENAIALAPRLAFGAAASEKRTLKAEEPFRCIRCGKPFATPSTIARLRERMAGHSLFATPARLKLIEMCEDCRVVAQFEEPAPFAAAPRPVPRTTDDYLREREAARLRPPPGDDEAT
jgi:ferredoxin